MCIMWKIPHCVKPCVHTCLHIQTHTHTTHRWTLVHVWHDSHLHVWRDPIACCFHTHESKNRHHNNHKGSASNCIAKCCSVLQCVAVQNNRERASFPIFQNPNTYFSPPRVAPAKTLPLFSVIAVSLGNMQRWERDWACEREMDWQGERSKECTRAREKQQREEREREAERARGRARANCRRTNCCRRHYL